MGTDDEKDAFGPLTLEARERGRKKALEARRARAEMKHRMRTGEVSPAQVLADEEMGAMRVYEFLMSVPRIGQSRAGEIMRGLSISETRRLRGLGPRQREGILAKIDEVLGD